MTRIAQVGCGYWGKNLVRNFSEIGALGAVVDGDPNTAAKMAETYGVPACNLDEVLADPDIVGVSFATPAETHADLAVRALEAGKHVYVEKPLALTEADCDRMITAAEATERTLMVGHLLQYHPIFVAMKAEVDAGRIGDLRYVYSNRMSLGKFRVAENVLWSFAPHDVSMVLSLVDAQPNVVTAQGGAFVTEGVADWCTMQFGFENGVRGHIQTSWLHPFKEQRLVAVGSKGMMVFEDSQPDWDKKLAYYGHDIDMSGREPAPIKAEVEYIAVPRGEPLKDECRHFVHAIETGTAPRTDGHEGRAVLAVLNAAEAALAKSLEGAA
ncbi:Gfo/Idh/MocA family protein [Cochlodiniinecator piscidefendens]|uniref:Gfo/Idh/MocA family protein n=1 Tax=Cochlodiniinecator piscidefendens TaxID=2715756 RepID=UPI00140DDBCD|nr:Gfo/Idh/MocA family oxidoreductase [Cochlodiniinecator piscidefendens]